MNLIIAFLVWIYLFITYFYLLFQTKKALQAGYQEELDKIKDRSYFYKTDDFAVVNIILGYSFLHFSKILDSETKRKLFTIRVVLLLSVIAFVTVIYFLPKEA